MMHSRTSIVCGVDGSAGSRAAIGVAAEFATRLDARLVLVHAVADPPPFPYGDAWERELQRGRAMRAGERLLDDAARGLDAVRQVTLGDPVAGLHTVCGEEDAELLVVGAHGHSRLAAAVAGRVSAHVVHGAACPVLIVPPEAGRSFFARGGSIICGYDGSPDAERALTVAAGLGERLGLEPVPVFVDPERNWNAAAPSHVQVLSGDPVRELRERARGDDARLIAVGSHGRGALRGVLGGSVSAALAATAPLPVLVVPPTARVVGPEPDDDARPASIAAR